VIPPFFPNSPLDSAAGEIDAFYFPPVSPRNQSSGSDGVGCLSNKPPLALSLFSLPPLRVSLQFLGVSFEQLCSPPQRSSVCDFLTVVLSSFRWLPGLFSPLFFFPPAPRLFPQKRPHLVRRGTLALCPSIPFHTVFVVPAERSPPPFSAP